VYDLLVSAADGSSAHSPGPRSGAAMAAVSSSEMILFGGVGYDRTGMPSKPAVLHPVLCHSACALCWLFLQAAAYACVLFCISSSMAMCKRLWHGVRCIAVKLLEPIFLGVASLQYSVSVARVQHFQKLQGIMFQWSVSIVGAIGTAPKDDAWHTCPNFPN
jgi:hypothetical protein